MTRKKVTAPQKPSESQLTALRRWTSVFSRLEKKPLCAAFGPFRVAPQGRREEIMKRFAAAILAGVAMSLTLASVAEAKDKVIGVSWSNFQEERWKTDEAAMKKAIEAAGDKYISADAQSNPGKQLTDVESLISQGANALIILAQDASAIGPAVQKALDEGIPVVGYDRLIENKDVFYLTFDNKEVGRMQAREVFKAK